MEKKEMSFIEIFEATCKDLGKKLEKSNNGAMIMIATSEGNDERRVSASIEGKSAELSTLLVYVAIKDKGFKTILTNAIKGVEAYEQRNK